MSFNVGVDAEVRRNIAPLATESPLGILSQVLLNVSEGKAEKASFHYGTEGLGNHVQNQTYKLNRYA